MCVGQDFDTSTYPICGEIYQSPVNIEQLSTVYRAQYAGGLAFHNYHIAPHFNLKNTGHSGRLRFDALTFVYVENVDVKNAG